MQNEIHKIYHNNFGIAFKWKYEKTSTERVQIVFRDMGFYLTPKEIKQFHLNIFEAKETQPCQGCKQDINSRFILLKTLSKKVDLALNKKELNQVEDLIRGTLFNLGLDNVLNNLSIN